MLEKIITHKKKELEGLKKEFPLEGLIKRSAQAGKLRGFKQAICKPGEIRLIAEVKKASPSKGVLREDFDPLAIAVSYEKAAAAAISVLTDKQFFQGDIKYLKLIRDKVKLPLLRKDFIIDQYQLYESLCCGADAVLLIAALLSADQLKQLYTLAGKLNLDVLCEVHNSRDLKKALSCGCEIIGINNRDLENFSEDLTITAKLIDDIPDEKIVVSESAISCAEDVQFLRGLGSDAVLIGEALIRSSNIEAKVKELMHG